MGNTPSEDLCPQGHVLKDKIMSDRRMYKICDYCKCRHHKKPVIHGVENVRFINNECIDYTCLQKDYYTNKYCLNPCTPGVLCAVHSSMVYQTYTNKPLFKETYVR